ncbi:MAG TPA: PAS domain-containing sensor histidine kinase [Chthoniobacterales bacterium]|nr:PAS domain-containing sensor histidine kinase [Chthoniobacterales bacterium]
MNSSNATSQGWSERCNAEGKLPRDTESMFHLLFERTADAVWLFDPGTASVLNCNESTVALMRCPSRAHLIGKRMEELFPALQPDGSSTVEAMARRIAETSENGNSRFEWVAQRLDGTQVPLEVNATRIERGGEPVIVFVSRDVTERKEAEAALLESEARFRLLFERSETRVAERTIELVRSNDQLKEAAEQLRASEARLRESEERFSKAFRASPALISLVRLSDGKFVEVNDAFARWLGLDPARLVANDNDVKELNLWLDREDREKFLVHVRQNGSVREVECQFRGRRGKTHTIVLSAEIIEINGEPHILGFGIDISERKQAEVELLRTLAKEKELGQFRSHFVSMVSHEFRTPLGIIQSSAEILEDYLDQLEVEERRDHLQSIRKNTRRMAGLMEEVLLLGSLDAGKMEFKPEMLEVQTFVRRLVEEVLSATNRRCPIELLLTEKPIEIQADARLLRHIFTNLLTNAVKYSYAGWAVRFEIERAGADIVCVIRDRGIGIPEVDREWLFNAFHRGQNVADRPGTGLCLVIVKRCVDLHGGKIKVESELGEGTAVTVSLPRVSPKIA